MLNGVLPPTVRCTAVADVAPDFHARFSCISRSYKYFFIRGSRNIEDMSAAASMFVGEHSFFNFCKIDPSKGAQQSFNRNVLHASIEPVRPLAAAPHPLDIFVFNVKATAFLWHQVRAMVAIFRTDPASTAIPQRKCAGDAAIVSAADDRRAKASLARVEGERGNLISAHVST